MNIKTSLGIIFVGEWEVKVHTAISDHEGHYQTDCFLQNYRGEIIRLVSRFSPDEKIATEFHQLLCQQAKDFLIR